ncbi:AAA family ATPase [Nocardia panacis]|uniref:AAA family ATPase n=1 Tax=Nocardia panacis TaxID=2340916 RepID=UPI00193A32AC|nr:ATP-binding protein [Nocardia panacis]
MEKPQYMFDRDVEWEALVSFATLPVGTARLGIVSGRRRMGKTYLLQALVERLGGFYFGASDATGGDSLMEFGAALAGYLGAEVPIRFDSWNHAVTYLFGLGAREQADRPRLIVLDEFPYLTRAVPELTSVLQREIDRYQNEPSGIRLLLCGSAMSVMGRLLAGNAPLRGRAQLEMVVRPFGYRDAAAFWDVAAEPALAAKLHAVVGGTPAYRGQFLAGDTPTSLAEFDPWLCRTVLSPVSSLFREARYLLAEEAEIRDTALYHSVLGAVARGSNTRGGIAGSIGRKAEDISHPLNVLEDCHLLMRDEDIFRAGKSVYRITEPLIAFYEAVMRPAWLLLERGQARRVWARSKERFAAQVAGPHFEVIAREFMIDDGIELLHPEAEFGTVGGGIVPDPANKTQIEIDVAVVQQGDGGHKRAVSLLGEAKWGVTMGSNHVDRLSRARDLLTRAGWDTSHCRLACFGGVGFSAALQRRADEESDVLLIGLDELYAQ